jgi:hypothetical protein
MQPVESSNIRAVGYDAGSRQLEVHFKNGGRYRYQDVPPEAHAEFLNSPHEGSHGKHFHQFIRSTYTSERL